MADYKKFFPQKLLDNGFSIMAELANIEFNKVTDSIQLLSTLMNIDRCPSEFLQYLADLIDFQIYEELDESLQRECMKYYLSASKEKGLKRDIQMHATYGDNIGYMGGDLFVPGTFEERPLAGVLFPRDYLFSWSKSAWSGTDKFPGNQVYREGVILIEVTRLNQIIMDSVEKVKPAGYLVVYKLVQDGVPTYITHTRVLE